MIRRAYEGFLSEEEISLLLKGENFRLNSDQIVERLEMLVRHRAEKEIALLEGGDEIELEKGEVVEAVEDTNI